MKNKTILLSVISCIGVVSTAYLSHKAALKAAKKKKIFTDDTTTKDKIVTLAPIYAPPVLSGVATIACILGTNAYNTNTQTSMMSSYAVLRETYQDYSEEVKSRFGNDTHNDILRTISVESHDERRVINSTCFGHIQDDLQYVPEEELLCYDFMSKRYYNSTVGRLLDAEKAINKNLALGSFVSVNDYYAFLGISDEPLNDDFGWYACDEYYFIDFEHIRGTTDDGLEYYIISPSFLPRMEDDEEWPVDYGDYIGWS